MNRQESNELEVSQAEPPELSDTGSTLNSILQTFNFIKVLFTRQESSKKENCSTSFKIERDDGNIEDVYVKIRFCVNRPRTEVYEFCRKVKHLPLFLTPLISVTEESETHSFWKMKILSTGKIVGWDMEITKEIKNQMISWSSAKKSALMTEGNVLFLDAPENHTTELRLFFSCKFLFNDLKDRSSILMKPAFKNLIKRDIQKFKKVLEIYNGEGGKPSVWI